MEVKETFVNRLDSVTKNNYTHNDTTQGPRVNDSDNLWCTGVGFPIRGTTLLVFSVGGVLCNGFMLLSILPNRRLRNVRHLLLIHLALTGIFSSVVTVGMSSVALINCNWIGGEFFCRTYSYMFLMLVFSGVWTIAGLSWDKYQTIASPLHHSQTTTMTRIVMYLMFLWITGSLLSLPPLIGASQFVLRKDMAMCTVDVISNNVNYWYPLLYLSLWYYIPFIMVSYCYLHIFRIARSQSSRIASSMIIMGGLIQAPIKLAQTRNMAIKGRRAIGTILYIIGAFMVTFLPFSLMLLVEMFTHRASNTFVVTVVTSLIQAAPMTNAIVYGVRNRILRESFVAFLSKKKADISKPRERRRGSLQSVQARPSSSLHISVLLRKPNIPLSPGIAVRPSLFRRTLSMQTAAIEIAKTNCNGEHIPMWSRSKTAVAGVSSTPLLTLAVSPENEVK